MYLCQLLAKHDILSAPLVVSPGLEDLETLEPTGTSAALVSSNSSAVSASQECFFGCFAVSLRPHGVDADDADVVMCRSDGWTSRT